MSSYIVVSIVFVAVRWSDLLGPMLEVFVGNDEFVVSVVVLV